MERLQGSTSRCCWRPNGHTVSSIPIARITKVFINQFPYRPSFHWHMPSLSLQQGRRKGEGRPGVPNMMAQNILRVRRGKGSAVCLGSWVPCGVPLTHTGIWFSGFVTFLSESGQPRWEPDCRKYSGQPHCLLRSRKSPECTPRY